MTPIVSVVIDTYNHEGFIAEAIESVLAQDFPRAQVEILVVDDGSTDRTPEIVRQFEPQVILLRKRNGGQASAINHGVANASGEFVAFLDGDDVWLPNKLSRVVSEFQTHPGAALVYNQFRFWDSKSGQQWDSGWGQVSGDIPADRRKLLAYCAAPTSSLAFQRELLKRIVPTPERCSFMHDGYLINSIAFLGPVFAIPEPLTMNRVHGGNLWFARQGQANPEVLQSRLRTRQAMIESIYAWALSNVPKAQLRQARLILRRYRLIQEEDEFLLKRPGRVRTFLHCARHNFTYASVMTPANLAYQWIYALAELFIGKHAHYLEGVRSRVTALAWEARRVFQRRTRADHTRETSSAKPAKSK